MRGSGSWICPECGAVNDHPWCRIDAGHRIDLGRTERPAWQCPTCQRLNYAGDERCRGCASPRPGMFDAMFEQGPGIYRGVSFPSPLVVLLICSVLVGVLALLGIGEVSASSLLAFLPLLFALGALVVGAGVALVLLDLPFTRRVRRIPAPMDRVVLVGLALWLVAQALPAYTQPPFLSDVPSVVPGIGATVFAWLDALWAGTPYGVLIAVAWSANIWLALALLARWRGPEWSLVLAVLACVASAVGLGILLAGGVPVTGGEISEVGIGSWFWFAGTCVVLVGVALPVAHERPVT